MATKGSMGRTAAVVCAIGLAVCGRAGAAQVDAVWFGGVGNWNSPGNWLGGVVPNNGGDTYNVKIDNGNAAVSSVTLDMAPAIDNITIDAGEMLSINNGQQFFVATGAGAGTINNAGTLVLNSGGGHTYIRPIAGGTVTLTGGGTLKLSNQTTNWIYGNTTGAALVNVNNTIEGAGNIGWSGVPTAFNNQGTVLANVSNVLVIDTAGAGVTNTGTMRAASGGTLSIQGTTVNNVGGLIEALPGSTVELSNGPTIVGGTLSTTGTGVIHAFNTAVLDGQTNTVSNNGQIRVINGHRLALKGAIQNSGTITMNSTGGFTYIYPNDGPVTLSGGGVVQLSDVSDANYMYTQGGGSLINVNNVIQGAGNVGWSGGPMAINNQGTIQANAVNWLKVDAGGTVTNTGTMRATAGATLKLENGNFYNVGGVIEALNGSTVELSNSPTIRGGALSTTGTGVISAFNGSLLDGQTDTVTSSGQVRVNNGHRLTLQGTINNTGTITMNSTGGFTYIHPNNGPVMLTGGGVVQLSDTNDANYVYTTAGGGSLTNVNNTIRGAGNFGWSGGPMAISNQGTIHADGVNALKVDAAGGVTNSGNMQATGVGGLQILSGAFTTSGNVTVGAGSSLSRTGEYTQTAGSTTVNGTMSASGGVDIQGGVLRGTGTISSPVTNAGSAQPGTSAGVLTINSTFSQTASGEVSIEIGGTAVGTQYDRLAVSGAATLAGTLSVALINGYVANIGDSFVVLTAGSVSGSFATLNLPCLQAQGKQFQVVIHPTTVNLSVVAAPSPLGDMNCDCVRDASDVEGFVLALTDPSAFLIAHPTCPILRGDFDGNLVVNGSDIAGFVDGYLP